jgi:hypothetical protein
MTTPRCVRCGGEHLFGPGPLRTSAHPNSSLVLVETPGSRFQDVNVQALVCLDCGAVDLTLSPSTLEGLRRTLLEIADDASPKKTGAKSGRRRAPASRRKKPAS